MQANEWPALFLELIHAFAYYFGYVCVLLYLVGVAQHLLEVFIDFPNLLLPLCCERLIPVFLMIMNQILKLLDFFINCRDSKV